MKKKTIQFKLSKFKYLLFLPILLFSFCESNFEEFSLSSENKLTKDAKVLSLMKSAVQSDLNKTSSKSTGTVEEDQCTHFLYPMTFEVYSGDDPTPQLVEINSDEELISFIDTLNTSNQFYIFFPITLLDTDGVPTEIKDLIELEGTLQMAVDACNGFQDDDSSGGGTDDGTDDGSGSNDESDNSGSDDGTDDGTNDSSGTNDGSDDGSDDGTNDGSGSNDGSDDGSDDGTNDSSGTNDGSDNSGSDDADIDGSDNGNGNDGYEYCQNNNKKVYICHKGITICVSVNAIWGHMTQHEEDYLGRCDDE